ncbi:hypothetical protein GCM10027160_30400 [Streptomyces calidiresistens]
MTVPTSISSRVTRDTRADDPVDIDPVDTDPIDTDGPLGSAGPAVPIAPVGRGDLPRDASACRRDRAAGADRP